MPFINEKYSQQKIDNLYNYLQSSKEQGEAEFRRVEQETILRLLDQPAGILSIGGGAFIQDEVRRILLERADCIYLKATPETLFNRVKGFTHRPLLQNEDPLGTLKTLLEVREPFYLKCSMVSETDGLSLDAVAENLIRNKN